MTITKLADVIKVPELMTRHISQSVAEKSELVKSKAATSNELINEAVRSASTTVKIPFNNDLKGRSQQYTESDIQVGKITSGSQKGVAQLRVEAWGSTSLASDLSGDDKMGAIATRVGKYWAEDLQLATNLVLQGVFASTSMSDHVVTFEYDESKKVSEVLAEAVIEAQRKLGKAGKRLSVIHVSSGLYAEMQKANLISSVRDPNNADISFEVYLGKYEILQSDELSDDEFYLFGDGAIFVGDGSEALSDSTEVGRDPLKNGGQDYLINRRKYMVHVNGVSYTGSVAGDSASDAEISNGANWTRVYESENVLALKVVLSEVAEVAEGE